MKFRAAIPLIMIAAGMPSAQLLPQKPAEPVKLDRALIFKVDYGNEAAPDSSRKIGASIKGGRENGNYLKNALIWTGLCFTGAIFSSALDSQNSLDCFVLPNEKLKF